MHYQNLANPKWDEIQNNLLPNQKATDRPDLVARVFWLKFQELRKKILNDKLFGKVKCFVWVIEWQKVCINNIRYRTIITMIVFTARIASRSHTYYPL